MKKPFPIRDLVLNLILGMGALFFVYACGSGSKTLPITSLQQNLKDVPTYSILLEDMKEEGNFITQYYHMYKVVFPEDNESRSTDWLEVPEDYYRLNESFLGMTLFVKKEGQTASGASPPGYEYVGDPKYGQWRTDSHGNSFWEFYGKYAFFSSLFGGWNRPIYRTDYTTYQQHRSSNVPYYGSQKQYGTDGSFTKQTKPNFYSRRMERERMKSTSFKNKVAQRTGRTKTGIRSRAGGFGK